MKHGEVYQLPARNGIPQFVPGINDPWNANYARLDFTSSTDDKEDAARMADSMAEHWAMEQREYDIKQRTEDRLAEIEIEIKDTYKDFRRMSREVRANCDQLKGITIVRELVRKQWQATKQKIHKLRAERDRIERNGIEY